jgi:hypothetical protein
MEISKREEKKKERENNQVKLGFVCVQRGERKEGTATYTPPPLLGHRYSYSIVAEAYAHPEERISMIDITLDIKPSSTHGSSSKDKKYTQFE